MTCPAELTNVRLESVDLRTQWRDPARRDGSGQGQHLKFGHVRLGKKHRSIRHTTHLPVEISYGSSAGGRVYSRMNPAGFLGQQSSPGTLTTGVH